VAVEFGEPEFRAAETIIEYALLEDLDGAGDLTCRALIDPAATAVVNVVAREAGVLAGGPVAELVFYRQNESVEWRPHLDDGADLLPGSLIAEVSGPLGVILTCERTALNFLTHLSGVATITRRFVDTVAGTKAGIFDTRKTTPGLRVLEKYAVRAGGGRNHRMGLYDGVLIKDNHIAALSRGDGRSLAEIVRAVRDAFGPLVRIPVEIEVDTLEQLRDALQGEPDQVLLDNMSLDMLREAVRLRDEIAPAVELEASGGVTLATVRQIAETGVDRISAGALTHSAGYLDIGFDWPPKESRVESPESRVSG
jgi:nicotinate-nucleotide pyrophosphorylase (carboxylating)